MAAKVDKLTNAIHGLTDMKYFAAYDRPAASIA